MSRSKRFISGLVSSYATIGVNIVYTLASVPLALHYLSKEEFGLWALVTQLTGYLMLLEFGMTGSVSRFLTDHKDDIDGGVYGSILKTGSRVFLIQGLLVAMSAFGLSLVAPGLLDLAPGLRSTFTMLMALQGILTGFKLATGAMIAPLWSHQRLDISNLGSCVSLVVNFAILWLGFHLGWKLYSLVVATAAGFMASLAICYFSCLSLRLLPTRSNSGKFDSKLFRQLFGFGGGLFLMNVGAQLASASQIILVSRFLGLEAASVWSISTKLFSLAQQFVARIFDSSMGGLSEMFVRGEFNTLRKRFHDLVSISATMAVAASAGIALLNGAFNQVWTSNKISWAPTNDIVLACVLFCTTVTRCNTSLVGVTKQIRGMKYIHLLEGATFILLAILLVRTWGVTGLLFSALFCNLATTGAYGVFRTAHYFQINRMSVIGWIARPLMILSLVVLFSIAILYSPINDLNPISRFMVGILIYHLFVIPSLWFLGINSKLRAEIKNFVSRTCRPIFLKFHLR